MFRLRAFHVSLLLVVLTVCFLTAPSSAPTAVQGTVSGTVTNCNTGEGLENVRIRTNGGEICYSECGGGCGSCSGNYEMLHNAGTYTLTADKAGYYNYYTPINVVAGQVLVVDFCMTPVQP